MILLFSYTVYDAHVMFLLAQLSISPNIYHLLHRSTQATDQEPRISLDIKCALQKSIHRVNHSFKSCDGHDRSHDWVGPLRVWTCTLFHQVLIYCIYQPCNFSRMKTQTIITANISFTEEDKLAFIHEREFNHPLTFQK